jgi:hypothetical protein
VTTGSRQTGHRELLASGNVFSSSHTSQSGRSGMLILMANPHRMQPRQPGG